MDSRIACCCAISVARAPANSAMASSMLKPAVSANSSCSYSALSSSGGPVYSSGGPTYSSGFTISIGIG